MVEDRLSSVSALSHEVAWKKKKREENGRGPFEQWVCSEPRGGAIESNKKKKTKENGRGPMNRASGLFAEIEGVRSISTRPRGGEEVISLGHLVAVCFILRVVRTDVKVRCNFMLEFGIASGYEIINLKEEDM